MKKLLFVVALGVAGLMSAKDAKVQTSKSERFSKWDTGVKTKAVFYNWVQIVSPCGAVYYLAYESYVGCTIDELYSDIATFNYAKCGVTGFEYQGGYS